MCNIKKWKTRIAMLMTTVMIMSMGTGDFAYAASELKTAKTAMEQALEALNHADAAVVEAQKEFDTKKDNIKLRQSGSLGFFTHYGYTDAADVLKRTDDWIVNYTNVGADKDATSLDNLKAIVPFLKEANEVRKMEGVDPVSGKALGELNVSMTLIAIEEVHTNWSATNRGHASNSVSDYRIGENLSWGYRDPFTGWVDEEKAIWLSETEDTAKYPDLSTCGSAYQLYAKYPNLYSAVGHYLNACDSTKALLGFAVNQKGDYSVTHGQSLDFADAYSDTMTVAQFEEKLNAYCAIIDSAEEAFDTLEQAKAAKEECREAYDEALGEYNRLYDLHKDNHDAPSDGVYRQVAGEEKHSWTCPTCDEVVIEVHKYTADCDDSCNVCGKEREVTVSHDFSNQLYLQDSDRKHYRTCKECGKESTHESCYGGTANCSKGAVCEICGNEYSKNDPTNHAIKLVPEKDATCENAGKKAYFECEYCHTFYEDAEGKNVIKDKSVLVVPAKGQTWDAAKPEVPQKGDEVKDDKGAAKYEAANPTKKEVIYKAPSNKNKKTVTIPATIKIDNVTYKVIKIDAAAFKGNKKVTKIIVGRNVKAIGKNAFSGCKKLKTIIIKSTKLKSKTVAKNAFKGITKKTTIKVPKKKLKAYKSLFRKKGLSSKVKVKK